MRLIIVIIALFALFSWGGIEMIQREVKKVTNIKTVYEGHDGDTITFSGESFIVVDFSTVNETYTLDNGVKVSRKLIENK